MEPADNLVPFVLFFMRVMRLVIEHQKLASTLSKHLSKAGKLTIQIVFGLRAKHLGHNVGFIITILLALCPVIKLLNVGEKKHAVCRGAFSIATHDTIELPGNFEFSWDEWIKIEDAPALKIAFQPFIDDDVGGNNQERFGVVIFVLTHCIEVLPGNRQRHHFRFAAACSHFCAIAGELIIGGQAYLATGGNIMLQEIFTRANLCNFVDIDKRFYSFALGIVVLEQLPIRQFVIGKKPVVEQSSGGVGNSLVAAISPFCYKLVQCRNTGSCPEV